MAEGFVFDDDTLAGVLDAYFDSLAGGDAWELNVFTNDHTPADGDDETDYDVPTWAGYAGVPMTMANWGAAAVAAHIATSEYSPAERFTYPAGGGAAVTIYGYFILDGDGNFVMAERVAAPVAINPGDSVDVTPRFKCKTCRG